MAEMNRATYIWAFEQCEIIEAKIQVKLMKVAKDLNISEWEMLIYLENLPDVSKRKRLIKSRFLLMNISCFQFSEDQNARRTLKSIKTTTK